MWPRSSGRMTGWCCWVIQGPADDRSGGWCTSTRWRPSDRAAPLPVLVDLRSYKQDESAEAFVPGCVRPASRRSTALGPAGVILFLDALNEMPYHDRGARRRHP
ncbi:MAG: hypothetical protein R3A10_13065 [Caldilineaceae bacterium]